MRIIAGKHRGRKIDCPKGDRVRPTSDMLRGAVFNILNNIFDWEETNVLDVFCGTGAVGLEALSRGAQSVCFIDNNSESIKFTELNLTNLGERDNVDVLRSDATKLPEARKQFDLVYLDPPYQKNLEAAVLKSLSGQGWLAEDVEIVIEAALKDEVAIPEGFVKHKEKKYGNSKIIFIKQEDS